MDLNVVIHYSPVGGEAEVIGEVDGVDPATALAWVNSLLYDRLTKEGANQDDEFTVNLAVADKEA